MYLQHFGLKHDPLGNKAKNMFKTEQIQAFKQKFSWLLAHPGIGILTGEPGLGKTALLRQCTKELNPHQYQVIYISETDFSRLEFYRNLAVQFNLQARYRRTDQWKELKDRIVDLVDNKHILPIFIIDESQNLSHQFWIDFPSFLNFSFDSRNMATVWFLGHPQLDYTLNRACYDALSSRIHVRHQLKAIDTKEEFEALIKHAFEDAGMTQTILSNSGIELIRNASQGKPRTVNRILVASLQAATDNKMNHLSDDIIQSAIQMLQG